MTPRQPTPTAREREAERKARERRARHERLRAGQAAVTHGRMATYNGWGCRCAACKAAYNDWHSRVEVPRRKLRRRLTGTGGCTRPEKWQLPFVVVERLGPDADPRVLLQIQDERRARDVAQRRYRWRKNPHMLVPLDRNFEDNFATHERIASPTSLDPFDELYGNHIGDVLGDLTELDVARMDEWQLQELRERLLAEGVVPSTVQRGERDRLKVIVPHRGGGGPAPTFQRMASRHRGRKEASALMSQRGKKFNRRKTKWREAA